MWTCPKCLHENGDERMACSRCGSPRSSRRFNQPSVQQAPYPQQSNSHFRQETGRVPRSGVHKPHQGEWSMPPLSRAAKLAKLCGTLLCLFLPLLCLLLAWKQFDVLYPVLVPLLTGSADHTFIGHLCYGLYSLCALLLTLLPGLSMLTMTGKYQKTKHREDKRLL